MGIAELFTQRDGIRPTLWKFRIICLNLKNFHCPCEIISYAARIHHRSALSTAAVEDLLADWGTIMSRKTIRLWVNHLGQYLAKCVRRDHPPSLVNLGWS